MASGTKHFFPSLSVRPSVQEVDKNNSPPLKKEGRNGPQVAFFLNKKKKGRESPVAGCGSHLSTRGKLIFFPLFSLSLYNVSLPYISSSSLYFTNFLPPFPVSELRKKKKSYRWATRLNDTTREIIPTLNARRSWYTQRRPSPGTSPAMSRVTYFFIWFVASFSRVPITLSVSHHPRKREEIMLNITRTFFFFSVINQLPRV